MQVRYLREKIALALILLLTASARIYYVLANAPVELSHDEIGYHQMTIQFLEKGILGYYSDEPNAFVTPGYPIFLAGVYTLSRLLNSDPLVTARLVQALLGVVSVYLVFVIARNSHGFLSGLLAASLAAIYPPSFMASARILTEVLYAFLLLCYVLSLIKAFRDAGRITGHIYSGVIFGITVLVRPAVAPFLLVPYMAIFLWQRDIKVLRSMFGAIIIFGIIMSPWWVRNYLVFDKIIVLATQTGNPLLRGTDPYDPYDKIGPSIIADVPESEMTKTAMTRIKTGFKDEPLYWLKWFTIGKFRMLWEKPWGSINAFTTNLHFILFFLLGWAGTLINLWDIKLRWAAMLIVVMTLTQLAFIPIERYMYPLTPLMAIMSTSLLVKIIQRDLTLDF